MAAFDGRLAVLLDMSVECGGRHQAALRFEVAAGVAGERVMWTRHPDMEISLLGGEVIDLQTDDPAEAQAAFERGAEWVRTGEKP
jgi:hypothetical protein